MGSDTRQDGIADESELNPARPEDGRRRMGIVWKCALGHEVEGFLGDPMPSHCPKCVNKSATFGGELVSEIVRERDSLRSTVAQLEAQLEAVRVPLKEWARDENENTRLEAALSRSRANFDLVAQLVAALSRDSGEGRK